MRGQRRAIYLVGMMGAGKSTIGPLLAQRRGRSFVDTDTEVARRAGRSIAEIFEHDGEAAFRELESREIDRAAGEGAVVALGGGALVREDTAERVSATGDLVYLRARPQTLLARIGEARSRPLLAGLSAAERLEKIRRLLEERSPAYERAAVVVDVDEGAPVAVVDRIVAALETRRARAEEGEA